MQKVYSPKKHDNSYSFSLPTGIDKVAGMTVFTLRIRKPSGDMLVKALDVKNLMPETNKFKFTLASGDVNQLGIYDYQLINTTGGAQQAGNVLQFHITENIF